MTSRFYKLVGHRIEPCEAIDLAKFFQDIDARRVAFTDFGGVEVSTVFLGVNHAYDNGPPMLFETMVFGGVLDGEMKRCSTWDQAETQHDEMCRRVTGELHVSMPDGMFKRGEDEDA